MLVTKNILSKRKDKTYIVFSNDITKDFLNDPTLPLTMKPSEYVSECWKRYEKSLNKSNSLNGKIFEVIIETLLCRCGIHPFYIQAHSDLVPDVDYDIVIYDKENSTPITISLKTTSRERYKQAALEAYAFKNVYRASLNYLVLNDEQSCISVQKKIEDGLVLGLHQAIFAKSHEFDLLIENLKGAKLGTPPEIKLFEGKEIV